MPVSAGSRPIVSGGRAGTVPVAAPRADPPEEAGRTQLALASRASRPASKASTLARLTPMSEKPTWLRE